MQMKKFNWLTTTKYKFKIDYSIKKLYYKLILSNMEDTVKKGFKRGWYQKFRYDCFSFKLLFSKNRFHIFYHEKFNVFLNLYTELFFSIRSIQPKKMAATIQNP